MQNPHTTDERRLWKADIADEFTPDATTVLAHGDCNQIMQSLPTGFAKLIITSPPYNLGKAYEETTHLDAYLDSLRPTLGELIRLLSSEGSLCWQVGNYVSNREVFPLDVYYYQLFKDLGLKLRNRIIWHFGHGLHSSKRFSGRYETLLWFTKSDQYTFNLDPVRKPQKYPGKLHFKGDKRGQPSGNPKGKNPSDFWEILVEDWESQLWNIPNVKNNHPEKTIHPCQFPIELVERCIFALTNENDWVFDPFSGVGSALLAALKHNRRAMGCEKDEQYLEVAQDRIKQLYDGSLRYRPLGKPVYQPSGRDKISQIPEAWIEKAASAN